jgi:hypothetical protein
MFYLQGVILHGVKTCRWNGAFAATQMCFKEREEKVSYFFVDRDLVLDMKKNKEKLKRPIPADLGVMKRFRR